MKPAFIGLAAVALINAIPAQAAYTTVNIDDYVNDYVAENPQTLPIGLGDGNTGTSIPFLTSAAPNNPTYSGIWLARTSSTGVLTIDLSAQDITGQATFYALLNNIYGTSGANEYNIIIETVSGLTATYQAIGGVDTRDYNQNAFTNDIAATTTEWFTNGIGQRYDVRVFTLPESFASDTIKSFTISQVNSRDAAIFAGLTFSDDAPAFGPGAGSAVPESASWTLMIAGFGLVGTAARRRKKAVFG